MLNEKKFVVLIFFWCGIYFGIVVVVNEIVVDELVCVMNKDEC